jgi:hypothetical protein
MRGLLGDGRTGTVCPRGACPAWSRGPSTSPSEPACAGVSDDIDPATRSGSH